MGGAFGHDLASLRRLIVPWSTPLVSELRTAFVHAVRTAKRPVVAACRDFYISRKTAYKWLARFDTQQPLANRSRKPAHSSAALEAAVLAVRDQYGWGPARSSSATMPSGPTSPTAQGSPGSRPDSSDS